MLTCGTPALTGSFWSIWNIFQPFHEGTPLCASLVERTTMPRPAKPAEGLNLIFICTSSPNFARWSKSSWVVFAEFSWPTPFGPLLIFLFCMSVSACVCLCCLMGLLFWRVALFPLLSFSSPREPEIVDGQRESVEKLDLKSKILAFRRISCGVFHCLGARWMAEKVHSHFRGPPLYLVCDGVGKQGRNGRTPNKWKIYHWLHWGFSFSSSVSYNFNFFLFRRHCPIEFNGRSR